MKTFPTLYKLTGRDNLQQWSITASSACGAGGDVGTVTVEHGRVGGKLQTATETIAKGKNPGKKNETSAVQQAELEAEAEWKKKKSRKGYVEDLERAKRGETDADGIPPMLAKTYEDLKDKDKPFPAHGQRKLNGVRCIVQVNNGVVKLWSRQRKLIPGVPHVQAAYEAAFKGIQGYYEIDGELYHHGWSLQKISGYVRKGSTKPGFEKISHNVYDLPVYDTGGYDRPWEQRQKDLDHLFATFIGDRPEIKKVETIVLRDAAHLEEVTTSFIQEGYEGLMYRNLKGEYEPDARSSFLLKVKRWKEEEFPIVGIHEGTGKFAGLAVFTCKTVVGRDPDAPKEFDCCAPGGFEDREEFFRQGDANVGKGLTVKFFEWTDEKKPFLPVGMAVRDYE